MTSMSGGRGIEDGRVATAFAPGDVVGVRRVMTLLGLPGAWLRRLRSSAFRAESSRIGGNHPAARRGRDCSRRPGSLGCPSAAARGVSVALDGVCRVTRADVLALVCLTLLAGVAAQAYAQSDSMLSPTIAASDTPPTKTMSFVTGSRIASEGSGTHNVKVRLEPAPTTDITLKYTVGGTATAGSDFTIANSGTLSVPRGATTATIPLKIVDGSEFEVDAETVVLELIRSAGYHPVEGNRYGSRHTLTIADNDSPWHSGVPIVGISGGGTVTEGESISFTLTAEPTPKRDLWVKLQVDDFAANSGPNPNSYTVASERGYKDLIIPAGKNSAVYRVQTDDDDADDDRYSPGAGVIQVAISGFYGMRYRKHPWKPSVRGYVWDNDGSSTNSTPTVSFASASQSAGEGSGTHDVGVRLGKAPATDITLAYTVGGTATSGSDYTALSGTVTVPKDATTATIPVTLIDDSVPESSETIVLTLAAGSDYAVGSPDTHTLTIAANDPPTASFASASQSAGEGTGTHDVEVRLDKAPATDLTLAYTVDGTATSGSDYTALSGTVTVSAGATTATLPVTLIDDSAEEGSETVVLTLATGSDYEVGSPDTHTLTIAASDGPPRISFEPLEGRPDVNARTWWVKEGSGTHDVKVKLSPAPASDITVKYKVVGNATSGSDYTALSGTVTVPKGATTATIPVTIIDDNEPEYAEEIALWLLGSSGYELTRPFTHHIIIDPSDGPPWVSLVPALQSAGEGSGTHDVGVRLGPAPAADIAFAYTVTGTATSGSDYKALSGSVTVSRGTTTATIPVTLIDDSLKEGSETIVLKLTGSAGYKVTSPGTHTLTVLDDETPTMSFASASQSVDEGSGTHDVEVRLDPAPTSEITLSYTVDGTATSGSDYTALSGTLSVPKGATTATVPVAVIDDSVHENGETVVLTLTAGSGYAVASPGVHTLSIADDDPAPPPGVDAALVAQVRGYAAETHQGQEHVDRWKRVLAAFGDDNGYTAMTAAEAQVFADKGWQRWVPVVAALEALEAAQQPLTLPAVSVSAGADVTEGGDAVFTVTASPAPAAELSVTVTVAAEGDFGVTAGSRTVPIPTAGSATLTLTTTGDDTDEPDGSVSVTVAAGEGYTIGDPASGSVAIADDDPTPTTAAVDPALIAQVRGYAAETWKHPEHVDRWRRVLAAFGDDNGYTAMTAAEAQTYADRGWQRWVPVVDALAALEAAPEPDPVTVPAVSVSAGADVTEGGDAVFTVTASPAPAADLAVSVDIAADGAYGITAGKRTVTIPTAGSATLTLATTNDDTDEPDGSVTATVAAGEGYTVGAPASGSVSIQDDDEPPPAEPAVTIAAGASPVTEGGDATFTLTASPAPASPLTVSVTVAVDGAYGITAGKQTVTIPTAGSATLTLATTNDDTDEPDGSVTVTLNDGEGYTVGAPASDTLSIEDDDLPPPVVTVTASTAPVTEGGDAVFTVSASRAPDADLAVTLEVADAPDSDFVAGGDEGARTVTIPDGATSVVFTLATANDATDEPDGVVTVTLKAGEGYTVGAPASDTLSIEDDDLPPPVVSIAAKAASVTEGGAATFTLTADRAPAADLTVTLAVSETGDHVAAETEGAATAVIARGETQAAFSVATVNDDADEPDGVVTVTLKAGEGYTVASSQGAATVTVSDDDAAPGPVLSVDDVTVTEGAWMEFTVRLSAPSAGGVSVKVSTRDSTPVSATARDYWPLSGKTVSFRAGETERSVGVIVYDDSHDEGSETFEVVLSDARGAPIGDGVAVGTIVNDDPMPAAWLGRFGRTVAEQALDGIAGRLAAPRTPGMQGAIAGQALTFGATSGDNIGPDYPPAGSPNLGGTGSRALSEAGARIRRSRRGRARQRPWSVVPRWGRRHAVACPDGARGAAGFELHADGRGGRNGREHGVVGPWEPGALRRSGGDVLARRRGHDRHARGGLCQRQVAGGSCARAECGRGGVPRYEGLTPPGLADVSPRCAGRGHRAVSERGARGRRHGGGVADGGHSLRVPSRLGASDALGRCGHRLRRGDTRHHPGRQLQVRHHVAHGGGGLQGRPAHSSHGGLRPGAGGDLGCAVDADGLGEDARPGGIGVRRDTAAARSRGQLPHGP